jgi:hypothetical protein
MSILSKFKSWLCDSSNDTEILWDNDDFKDFAKGVNAGVARAGCPLSVWKAVEHGIMKCYIPTDSVVVTSTGNNKVRTNKLFVDKIYFGTSSHHNDYDYEADTAESIHYSSYRYKKHEMHTPDKGLDKSTDVACAAGLHVFPKKPDAINYHAIRGSSYTERPVDIRHVGHPPRARARNQHRR